MHPLIESNRKRIAEIAERHGAHDVHVFGSFARGDAAVESDVDFLVEAGQTVTPWFPGGLVADLEDLLGRRVDVVTRRALNPLLRERVLKEAVRL